MSGEVRIVRGAIGWSLAAAATAALLAGLLWRPEAGVSIAIAAGLVVANTGAAAGISALASRISTATAAMVALPSFAVRMLSIFGALAWLQTRSYVDRPVFAATFCVGVTVIILFEMRGWRRTPWLALTFAPEPTTEERT